MLKDIIQRNTELEKANELLKIENERLIKENAELRAKIFGRRKKSTTSETEDKNPEPKKRGLPVGHKGYSRQKPDKIDETEIVKLTTCPCCGNSDLTKTEKIDTHIQEDIVIPKVKVTKYVKYNYYCNHCKKVVSAKGTEELPKSYIGPVAKTVATVLKYAVKVSDRDIKKIFKNLFQLKISTGAIPGFRNQLRKKCNPVYEELLKELKKSSFIHADETGWIFDGKNYWLWSFANKNISIYHIDKSRGQKVVSHILGEKYDGVLITDFLSAYNKLEAIAKQKCLVHLLRDVEKILETYQDDKIVMDWSLELKKLLKKAIKLNDDFKKNKLKEKVYKKLRAALFQRLQNFEFPNHVKEVLVRLSKRIKKFKDELFTFLFYDNVDYHNNHAEQQIRPNVLLRKITFGNRSESGTLNHNVLMSIIQTAKLNKKNPFEIIKKLLFFNNKESPLPLFNS